MDPIFKKQLLIKGKIQGVGFRPYVFRLASSLKLKGYVQNIGAGVRIFLIGSKEITETFQKKLISELPPRARIDSIEEDLAELGDFGDLGKFVDFKIINSEVGNPQTSIPQDVATCSLCLAEIMDPKNKRYLHPFVSCIHCGPRFSIMTTLPYDRQRTWMREFEMCTNCLEECNDPLDRRFHSQTNCCWNCGPRIYLSNQNKEVIARDQNVYELAAQFLAQDKIIAVKTIGGFQLWVNAKSDKAIARLRQRKNRPTKPFAVLCENIFEAGKVAFISDEENKILQSEAAPIVLLKSKNILSSELAPKNPYLGVMLPSSPIQNLILHYFNYQPIIATSGNISGEPICFESEEAFERLSQIADYFICHDRKIQRPLDDSIVQVILEQSQNLRIGRGLAPLELTISKNINQRIAFGGDLKASLSVSRGDRIFLGPHLGDLEDIISQKHYTLCIDDLSSLVGLSLIGENNIEIICDKHPQYISAKIAQQLADKETKDLKIKIHEIQHHKAHAMSAILDASQKKYHTNDCDKPILVLAWDGTGFGDDGMLWGSEFFLGKINQKNISNLQLKHYGGIKPFPMPGGTAAIRDPKRLLFGLLWSYDLLEQYHKFLSQYFSEVEIKTFKIIIENKINCPWTTSMGRVFDAFAVLFGLGLENTFEGELACQLEFAARRSTNRIHRLNLENLNSSCIIENKDEKIEISLKGILISVLDILFDSSLNTRTDFSRFDELSLQFHLYLVGMVKVAILNVIKKQNIEKNKLLDVFLTGGVFQNRLLTELMVRELENLDCKLHIHNMIPPNDGGISAGQILLT